MNDNPCPPVVWWWTPDCGYLHVETDPVTISWHCDHPPDEPEDAADDR